MEMRSKKFGAVANNASKNLLDVLILHMLQNIDMAPTYRCPCLVVQKSDGSG